MEGKVSGAVLGVAVAMLGPTSLLSMVLTTAVEGVTSGLDTMGDCAAGDSAGGQGPTTDGEAVPVGRRVPASVVAGVGTYTDGLMAVGENWVATIVGLTCVPGSCSSTEAERDGVDHHGSRYKEQK
ncbi:hypothetical protein C8R43DRAFT_1103834, partial [Mycena crocata]